MSLNANNNFFTLVKREFKTNHFNLIIHLLIILNNSLISEQTLMEKYEQEGILEHFMMVLKQPKLIQIILDH